MFIGLDPYAIAIAVLIAGVVDDVPV